jgi:hypothetical protein
MGGAYTEASAPPRFSMKGGDKVVQLLFLFFISGAIIGYYLGTKDEKLRQKSKREIPEWSWDYIRCRQREMDTKIREFPLRRWLKQNE